MVKVISVTVLPQEEHREELVKARAAALLGCGPQEITALVLHKRSVDARRGRAKIILRYGAYVGEDPPPSGRGADLPVWKTPGPGAKQAVIVGAGPAGLFAALRLLEEGIRPVILEQGKRAEERKRDIAAAGVTGRVDPWSNYCFGEGGAGTFSDGKLLSRSKKRGNTGRILAVLHHFGGDASILTDARPHIGTDRLPPIVTAITGAICSHGGEVRFQTQCTGFLLGRGRVLGVRARDLATGGVLEFPADAVILAPGHSAPRVYAALQEAAVSLGRVSPVLEAKTFACGVRVEHPRRLIDSIQYRGTGDRAGLPAAEYRLAAQVEGRGVYSFCMCPGGIVVPASSGPEEIVVNGMSPSGRNTRWSNAGIVVETRREDCAAFLGFPPGDPRGEDPLVSLTFREAVEKRAFREGEGGKAPAQGLADFLEGRMTSALPRSSFKPGLVPSRLDQWLPPFIVRRLKKAFREFDRAMGGFVCGEALLIAPETRTSSPVRILRDGGGETLPGLFACGEGSGYSGGIVSSALDGENAAAKAAAGMTAG
ncbi:MAG: FAD-dependent monooxygenase [Spirochaetaceae bacterium]|jgi:uncharacterized FAD-dependent dehydrogenase|nr:FAD-dependent monooxygenase [Spirochaetaceae bacterium]